MKLRRFCIKNKDHAAIGVLGDVMYCYKCLNFLITDAEPQNVSCIDLTELDADFIDLTSPAPNDASIIIVSLLSNTYSYMYCHISVCFG